MAHIDTVQAIYAAFGRGDIPAILERLAEDVEWEHDAADHRINLLVPRRGRADVAKFFQALGDLEFTRFEVERLFESGGQVVALTRVGHKHLKTRKTFADLEVHLWTLDARGQVARFRHFVDSHALWLQQQP
jgi:ketosteroid isomerase-like protein